MTHTLRWRLMGRNSDPEKHRTVPKKAAERLW
jgi:hypothetical protein